MVRRFSVGVAAIVVAGASAQSSFVNWENPPLHSAEMTPDGSRLLIANTADNRVEVFAVSAGGLASAGAIPVGLDPVTVRARTATEAWVVNHISDSISIVDLTTMRVVNTIDTADEPYDVVFAGTPQRAFVSCSQVNTIQVFDPTNLVAPPTSIVLDGEDPRGLAVSPDGSTVYVAIFESGNYSTILGGGAAVLSVISFPPNAVSDVTGPYAGVNPPPNDGAGFSPPQRPGNPAPPRVGLIVKKDAGGAWRDDNGTDWTSFVSGANASRSGRPVGWDLFDHDVAVIDANTLSVEYVPSLMNICMGIAVNPSTGVISVIGTDATNEIRYEPVLKGKFIRVNAAFIDPLSLNTTAIRDLNAHLDYSTASVDVVERNKSIGDPRAIVWKSDGSRGYVSGMGSNNVIVIDADGDRVGILPTIGVGEGPVGLALDEANNRLYVHNRFSGSVSAINLTTEAVASETYYYDPTPDAIRDGRRFVYNTHEHSGLGQIACGSCHVDARMDRLAWDLGDPAGTVDSLGSNNLGFGLPGLAVGTTTPAFEPFHPMKGPMTTQTLQDIIGHEPHHWRGDRTGIEAFAAAFVGLQGGDAQPSASELQAFESFLASVTYPPNPYRNFDNTLPTTVVLTGFTRTGRFGNAGQQLPNGNAQTGMTLYRNTTRRLDQGAAACVTCHTLPTGMGTDMRFNQGTGQYQAIAPGPLGERHLGMVSIDGSTNVSMKVPQLRNMHEKAGFDMTQTVNRAGFGYGHDGAIDSISRFVSELAFSVANDQEVANLVAFMLAFAGSDLPAGSVSNPLIPPGPLSKDTHAAVGTQMTILDAGAISGDQETLMASMLTQANANKVGLVARGRIAGLSRGFAYVGANTWQSDRADETISHAALLATAAAGSELTFTVVPRGSQTRIGIDRDEDTFPDRTEIEACSDPADPASIPGGPGGGLVGDLNGDLAVNLTDLATLLANFGRGSPVSLADGDIDGDDDVDLTDLALLLSNFGTICGG